MGRKRQVSEPLQYVVKAALIAVIVYGAASLLPVEKWTSDATASLLTNAGLPAHSYEDNGRIYLEYLQISVDCTAIEVIAIFLGLLLAAPSPLYRRVFLAFLGSLAVFSCNVARIGIVYVLLEKGVPWYAAHDAFSGILAVLAGMLFLAVTERYLPPVNANLYSFLDTVERFLSRTLRLSLPPRDR